MRRQAPWTWGQGQWGVATDPPVVPLASLHWWPKSGGPKGVPQEGGGNTGQDGGEEAQGGLWATGRRAAGGARLFPLLKPL